MLNDQGFIAMLETIRRDVAPPWKAYFNFDESFSRFVEYMVARYGAYNLIFSKVHFDIYLPNLSLTAEEFNQALNNHYKKYGPMPFGQPVTSLIDHATDTTFGTGEKAPWITMHSTGNKPRDHGIYADMERQFRLSPAMPTANLEPHYTGWVHGNNVVNGEQAESGSDRDNYFSRAQMYGCVLSGGLAGHVHGTGAYDVTSASTREGGGPISGRHCVTIRPNTCEGWANSCSQKEPATAISSSPLMPWNHARPPAVQNRDWTAGRS